MFGMNGTSSVSSMNFDYRTAQLQLKAAMAGQKNSNISSGKTESGNSNTAAIKTLKKDSAAFLDKYAADMEKLQESADKFTSNGAAKMLAGEAGSDPKKNAENVVKAAQEMVDAYNKALATVSGNATRGSGTDRMAERMERAIASDRSFEVVGITRKEDGSLSLDQKKLTEALSGNNKNRTTEMLSSISGAAKRVASDALIQSPQSLINYDLSAMKQLEQTPSAQSSQQQQSTKQFDAMSLYSRSGAYNMMNMGTIGFLMNTFA